MNTLFTQRIRLLRESHNLSVSQASQIFGKNKAAFSQIELGNVKPSFDFLLEISNFFAVSLDWLLGRAKSPYSVEVIEALEDALIADRNGEYNHLEFFKCIRYYYRIKSDYYLERDNYSLEQRSNVIFALNFWAFAANKLFNLGYNAKEISITGGINYLSEHCSSKRAGTSFTKLCNQNIEILVQTLTR